MSEPSQDQLLPSQPTDPSSIIKYHCFKALSFWSDLL